MLSSSNNNNFGASTAGSGSGPMQIEGAPDVGGAGNYHNNEEQYPPNQHEYRNNPNENNYTLSAGASSSQQPLSSSSTSGIPTDVHNTTHYSQYTSLPYPYELTVYSWGRGEDGQLGIGDTSDQNEPTYVDSLRGVGVKQVRHIIQFIILLVTRDKLPVIHERTPDCTETLTQKCFRLILLCFAKQLHALRTMVLTDQYHQPIYEASYFLCSFFMQLTVQYVVVEYNH